MVSSDDSKKNEGGNMWLVVMILKKMIEVNLWLVVMILNNEEGNMSLAVMFLKQ